MSERTLELALLTVAVGLIAVAFILLLILLRRSAGLSAQNQRLETLINQVADELLDAMDARQQETRDSLRDALSQQAQLNQAVSAELTAMIETARQLDARMEQLRQGMHAIRQENSQQLTEMRQTVDEKLSESLDRRLTQSFDQISRRLEAVWRGLGEMQTLAAGVGDLKKMLTNVKTRGVWGEIQLGALLEEMLSPEQYTLNACVKAGSQERVEFAIRLPGRDGSEILLPIDSKFPQEDYLRLQEAVDRGDTAAAEACRKALSQRIRSEAKRIASKYILPPATTDFAVMFLPIEGLYAEAVRESGLTEELQRTYRVTVAGPTTLSALLNALQMGFRTLAIEQRSGEVWRLLGEVKEDFGRFAENLEKTRMRLQQASDSIDSAVSRTQSIRRRLSAVESEALPTSYPSDDAQKETHDA